MTEAFEQWLEGIRADPREGPIGSTEEAWAREGWRACEEQHPYTTEQLKALIARVRQEQPGWFVDLAKSPTLTRADVLAWPIEELRERLAVVCEMTLDSKGRACFASRNSIEYWRPDENWAHLGMVFEAMQERGWHLTKIACGDHNEICWNKASVPSKARTRVPYGVDWRPAAIRQALYAVHGV